MGYLAVPDEAKAAKSSDLAVGFGSRRDENNHRDKAWNSCQARTSSDHISYVNHGSLIGDTIKAAEPGLGWWKYIFLMHNTMHITSPFEFVFFVGLVVSTWYSRSGLLGDGNCMQIGAHMCPLCSFLSWYNHVQPLRLRPWFARIFWVPWGNPLMPM